jgi:hypothetical protein
MTKNRPVRAAERTVPCCEATASRTRTDALCSPPRRKISRLLESFLYPSRLTASRQTSLYRTEALVSLHQGAGIRSTETAQLSTFVSVRRQHFSNPFDKERFNIEGRLGAT